MIRRYIAWRDRNTGDRRLGESSRGQTLPDAALEGVHQEVMPATCWSVQGPRHAPAARHGARARGPGHRTGRRPPKDAISSHGRQGRIGDLWIALVGDECRGRQRLPVAGWTPSVAAAGA
jgi:hypothetical protein